MEGKLTRIYSEALFDAALENGKLPEVTEDVKRLSEALSSPDAGNSLDFGTLQEETRGFFSVCIEKDRTELLPEILADFLRLSEEKQNKKRAVVTTASQLSETQKQAVYRKLLETSGASDVIIDYRVDESLVGGIKIELGSKMVDGSVRTKLEKMKRELLTIQLP